MTSDDLKRLTHYITTNAHIYEHEFLEDEENGRVHVNKACVGRFDEIYELMAKFVAQEADKTCGPNYEELYETATAHTKDLEDEIKQLKKNIFDLECLNREYECRDAYKNGAIEMIELITGRRMGYNECGGMTIGPR